MAFALLILFIPAGLVIAIGTGASPAARIQSQQQRIKNGDASIEELAEALQSPNHDVRFWAVTELEKQGPRARAAVPALAQALQDHQSISWPAASALAAIGPDAAPAIPALVEVIEREQGQGKRSEIGDTPTTFSWLAGTALARIGPASLPEPVRLLVHQDRFVRMTAINALRNMGPQAKDAVPALNDALNDEDELVRRFARVAIDRIEGRRSVVDGEPAVRKEADKEHQSRLQKPASVGWITQAPFADDPRNRPPGTVCVAFEDGYRWLITDSVIGRELWNQGDRRIEAVVTDNRRYEHVLGTHEVRIIDPLATPRGEAAPTRP